MWILLLVLACDGPATAPATRETPAAEAREPEPTPRIQPPYTRAQLKDAIRAGRSFRIRIAHDDHDPFDHLLEVKDADAAGVTLLSTSYSPTGELLLDTREKRQTWVQLYDDFVRVGRATASEHASFDSALGRKTGWCYDAHSKKGEVRVCFADDLIGPPVLAVTTRDGAEVARSELVDHRQRVPGEPP